jgi:hypothetical protein
MAPGDPANGEKSAVFKTSGFTSDLPLLEVIEPAAETSLTAKSTYVAMTAWHVLGDPQNKC